MARLSPRARKAIQQRIEDRVDAVDSAVLENQMVLADDCAPDALHHVAETIASARHAASCTRDIDADATPVNDRMDDAWAAAGESLTMFVDELLAAECAHVIEHADEWAARNADPEADVLVRRSADDYDAAKREAREWLREHADAAERAGVLKEHSAGEEDR
jgi:hypothetical protein